jgi:transcriptional regulator with XRE-family HTH domain
MARGLRRASRATIRAVMSMADATSLGTTIRMRRRELGLSQEELAERIRIHGVSIRQTEISRIELDKVTLPGRDRLEAIALALDMPLGELLSRSGWTLAHLYFDRADHEEPQH